MVERFIEVSSRQLYPKPDIAGYLKGNLEDNLLGIKLFRYYYKKQPALPTVEMEFVHKISFLQIRISHALSHIFTPMSIIIVSNRQIKQFQKCDCLCENRPQRHIWYFEKYHFETLKLLQFSCAVI